MLHVADYKAGHARSRSFFGKRLQQTPSGLFWLEMAEQVLRNPLPAPLPFREASYVPADEVQAIA